MASVEERRVRDPDIGGEGAPAGRRRGRNRGVLIVAALLLIAAGIWGVRFLHYARTHESTDDAQVDGHIVPVMAKVGGYVAAVPVAENDHVAEGALLVQIDGSELRVDLEKAQADLQEARAAAGDSGRAGQAAAQVDVAANERAALAARIAAARAMERQAENDLERMRVLADKDIVSAQQLDAARSAAETARANVQAVERQAAAAGAGVSNARAGARMADARLAAARAAVDDAALQLSYARVAAPVSGIVSKKQVEPGQLVQAGQPLMAIVADTGVYVTANMKETQLDALRAGQPATIDVDAYPHCEVEGVVESVSPATGARFSLLPPDNATGNFTKVVQRVPIRVRVTRGCGDDRPLRPGLSVEVHVRTG